MLIRIALAIRLYIVLRSMAILFSPEPRHVQMCGVGLIGLLHPRHTILHTLDIIRATLVAPNATLIAHF